MTSSSDPALSLILLVVAGAIGAGSRTGQSPIPETYFPGIRTPYRNSNLKRNPE